MSHNKATVFSPVSAISYTDRSPTQNQRKKSEVIWDNNKKNRQLSEQLKKERGQKLGFAQQCQKVCVKSGTKTSHMYKGINERMKGKYKY